MISYVTSKRPIGSRVPETQQQQLVSPLKFIQFSRGLNNFYNLLPVNLMGQSASPGERFPLAAANQSLLYAAHSNRVTNGPFELEQLQATETRANGKSAAGGGEEFVKVDQSDELDEPVDDEEEPDEKLEPQAVNQTTSTSASIDAKITRQANNSPSEQQHASSATGSSISIVRQQHYEQHEQADGEKPLSVDDTSSSSSSGNKTTSTSARPEVERPTEKSSVVAMKAPTQALGGNNELLVGPFKSEAEAPATITLSGVVYQKSGASSALIRTSHSSRVPLQYLTAATTPYAPQLDEWLTTPVMQQQQQQQPLIYSTPHTSQTSQADLHFNQQQPQAQASLVRFSPFSLALATPSTGGGGGELSLSGSNPKAATTKLPLTTASGHLYANSASPLTLGPQLDSSPLQATSGSYQLTNRLPGSTTVWTSIGKPISQQQQALELSSQVLEASESKSHGSDKHAAPIVIVQKDVKPVKYHLLRAYLKLRRLLRPFEATYVFPSESGGARAALDRSTGAALSFMRRARPRRRQPTTFASRQE